MINSPNVFLLIAGKRYAGKDTLALMIKDYCNFHKYTPQTRYEILPFSRILKQEYCQQQNISFEQLTNDRNFKEKHRKGLIQFGFEKRCIDKNIWPKRLIQLVNQNKNDIQINENTPNKLTNIFSVPDARFPDEIDYISNLPNEKAYSIRVVCSDEFRGKRGWKFDKEIDTDNSECALDSYSNWDFVIENNFDNISSFQQSVQPQLHNLFKLLYK